VVKLTPDAPRTHRRRPVYYVGVLIRKAILPDDPDCWEIQFMRRHPSGEKNFTFPAIDDIVVYPKSTIIQYLNVPTIDKFIILVTLIPNI
jgi:hypothetical protein